MQLNQNNENDPPYIGDQEVPCLFWADDIILISKSKTGLMKNIDILQSYCTEWHMKVNTDKTKIIIFNRTGKVCKRDKFLINGKDTEIKKNHKYLGFLLECNGQFQETINDLANKGKRASYSIYELSTVDYISITTMLDVFATTIKPILLYGSEIWRQQSKNESKIEKVQTMFAKHILGVHRKSTNAAVLGELGLTLLAPEGPYGPTVFIENCNFFRG